MTDRFAGVARGETLWDNYEIPMFLGIAAFFFAFMLGIVGGVTFLTDATTPLRGMCIAVLVILIVGGAAFVAIGMRGRNRVAHLENVADLLKGYRRMRIEVLANKLGVTPMEAEYTIAECLGRDLVEGYFDRRSGEFFTKEALYQVMNLDRCPICGAPPTELYLKGEEIRCKYCGTVGAAAVDAPQGAANQ